MDMSVALHQLCQTVHGGYNMNREVRETFLSTH